jgi:hypothetical protein
MEDQNIELRDEQEVAEAKGHDMKNAEAQSIAATDKAANATTKAPARTGDKSNSEPMPKTKAGMISAMTDKMLKMSKSEMNKLYASYSESVDMEENDELVETQVDTHSEELEALVESEATLSDEFKAKTAVIFEAALKSKLSEEVERIEASYEEKLAEETAAQKGELVEKVDSYLNYVVEQWMEENKVAIQTGLRAEIAENFMEGLKNLFTESYIDVPESKIDLVDDLADQVEELEEALNKTTANAISLSEEVEGLKRAAIVAEAASELADTQKEKFYSLVEGVDFDDAEQFASKVATIKESFFANTTVETEEEITEETDGDVDTEEVSPFMEQYLSAMRKINK